MSKSPDLKKIGKYVTAGAVFSSFLATFAGAALSKKLPSATKAARKRLKMTARILVEDKKLLGRILRYC